MVETNFTMPSGVIRCRWTIRLGLAFLVLALSMGRGILSLSQTAKTVRPTTVENGNEISRRLCLTTAAAGLLAGIVMATPASAEDSAGATTTTTESEASAQKALFQTNRNSLLQSISKNGNDEPTVLAAIEALVPLDPSMNKAATLAEDLDGEWELLWSAKAEAFSPLLKLPKPFKPDSFQYLGSAAAGEVGPDRVA